MDTREALRWNARDRDLDLVRRVAEGDQAAFTILMATHRKRVLRVCLRITENREDALDAVQETFLTLYRKAGQYRGEASVSTWLHRVAVNTCLDLLRKGRRRPAVPLPDELPADPTPFPGFDAVEARIDLETALASLSSQFRTALVLTDLEGLRSTEASRVLAVPVGTVKSRVFRARRELGRLMADQVPAQWTEPTSTLGHPTGRADHEEAR